MNITQFYCMMGWPLRFWHRKTVPPQPIAHNIQFDEAVALSRRPPENPTSERKMTDEEFREKCRAMDARYSSLKQGESLGRLTAEEYVELIAMETGHGWCLDLTHERRHERRGQRRACFL
jgi:hypothetical protein